MDFTHYSEFSAGFAADLVNTSPPLEPEPDGLDSVEALRDFLLAAGVVDDDQAERLTDEDLRAFQRLRDELGGVFSAADEQAAARAINSVLDLSGSVPRLYDHAGSHPHLHFSAPGSSLVRRIGASSAMELALLLSDGGLSRFGFCADHNCVDVFVDESKNRSRRYCSDGCSNRSAVAAHRARARAHAEKSPEG